MQKFGKIRKKIGIHMQSKLLSPDDFNNVLRLRVWNTLPEPHNISVILNVLSPLRNLNFQKNHIQISLSEVLDLFLSNSEVALLLKQID